MRMIRIRRPFALYVCGVCTCVFLTLYLLINFPGDERKRSVFGSDKSALLRESENVKRYAESSSKPQLWKTRARGDFYDEGEVLSKPELLQPKQQFCDADSQDIPHVDIQMGNLYDQMSFLDVDGGAWKQGWNIKYDNLQYNEQHKLKVFVMPHSHNDPGWIKTFEDYYKHETKHILSNVLRHLKENPEMKFIWAEISYFQHFFEELGQAHRQDMKKLVQNGQLEFVTGGWVMPDEANSHWFSVLLQLTEGQTWLKQHLNVTPVTSWQIDPFGHSPTMPYILKGAGLENMLIQRTHYSVKKELAQKKQLEFFWRQLWDRTGKTDVLTHMMPFYSYDIPHTCGPDPKVCCQFDFKRLSGFGLFCPWRVQPRPIDDGNVLQRSELLVDQWKKKAELYKTNVLLVPLGDDFRFSQSTEWNVQRVNYNMLFDFINSHPEFAVDAKFGTLKDYFQALRREHKGSLDFPTLSGDFFTYADRTDNYWSGYFTSRPYHKRMDRVLLHYLRSAEMLHAFAAWPTSKESQFTELLQQARRQLSLFQHHDGVTGTAKTHVMEDYAQRMNGALQDCRLVIGQAAYKLLTKPTIYNPDFKFNYFYMDDSRWPATDAERTTIILGEELPSKHVVFHNSLAHWREEVVDFFVSSPYMSVRDLNGRNIPCQLAPVWSWYKHPQSNMPLPQVSTTKYRLIFKAKVPPLGMVTYVIKAETITKKPNTINFASNLILSDNPMSINMGEYPEEVKFAKHREVSLRVGEGPAVAFNTDGMMKSIKIEDNSPYIPLQVKFLKYGTRPKGERSGAYLFLPNGPATPIYNMQPPVIVVSEGAIESSVTVGLPFAVHQTILRGGSPEIRNLINIKELENTEITMRFMSELRSDNKFFTDLNGLQMIQRTRLDKLPLQANYYPMPTAAYIEDEYFRLTVLNAQSLGVSSMNDGELEIMQDRRLNQDDERGLGQGVLDNQPVMHIFRVLVEKIGTCNEVEYTAFGSLTKTAFKESQAVNYPLNKLIFAENDWLGVQANFGEAHKSADDDLEMVTMRQLSITENEQNVGLVLHRTKLLRCGDSANDKGIVNVNKLLEWEGQTTTIYSTTWTFLQRLQKLNSSDMTLCPMDTKALILKRRIMNS